MTTTQDPQASVPYKPNDKRRRKGRPGVARKLTEAPDKTRDIFAERCDGCGTLCSPNDQPNVHAWDHIPSVIFRKITNGFRSMWGCEVYADTASVIATVFPA